MNFIEKIIICYIFIVNITTLLMFGLDKWKAKNNKWRIPESTLLILSLVGGSIGAFCGIRLFHHKTLHKRFYIGVPLILLLQILVIAYFTLKFKVL